MKGDRFAEKSFTVPASAGTASYCAAHGHTEPDAKGKCLRCGVKVRHTADIAYHDVSSVHGRVVFPVGAKQ